MQKTALALLLIGLPLSAAGTEFSGYVSLTSDFVRRGLSQSDSDPAIQLGVDVTFDNGFVAGAWSSTVDNLSKAGQQHDIELNVYAGYGRDIGDRWRLSGFMIAYEFPQMETPFDYGYVEYAVSANYDDRFWIESAFAPDYYGTGRSAWSAEALGEWPLYGTWRLSAGIGRYDLGRVVGSDYLYWQLGATGDVGIASLDLRFHGTDRAVPFFGLPDNSGERIALTITVPF